MQQDIERVLEFWFTSAIPSEMATHRQEWWIKDAAFDRDIEREFSTLHKKAAQGTLDHWKESPLGCLALVILLDQFPRNIYRNDARSFSCDEAAREITRHALEHEFDTDLPMGAKLFLYLPLEHSEDIDDQNACVALVTELDDENYLAYAIQHRDIIKRFKRFPHRNAILGRTSTPAEIEFLKQPNSSF